MTQTHICPSHSSRSLTNLTAPPSTQKHPWAKAHLRNSSSGFPLQHQLSVTYFYELQHTVTLTAREFPICTSLDSAGKAALSLEITPKVARVAGRPLIPQASTACQQRASGPLPQINLPHSARRGAHEASASPPAGTQRGPPDARGPAQLLVRLRDAARHDPGPRTAAGPCPPSAGAAPRRAARPSAASIRAPTDAGGDGRGRTRGATGQPEDGAGARGGGT